MMMGFNMFKIHEVTDFKLRYSCECGAVGECMFVPVGKGASLVLDLKCPLCSTTERLKISEEGSSSEELQWAIVVDNDLTKE